MLYIASDHAGYPLKERLKLWLAQQELTFQDLGTHSAEAMDYPDITHPLATAVEQDSEALGILICGSGNGVCITANKHAGIRAALAWNETLAALARQHNDANVLCLPARFIEEATAEAALNAFLNHSFEGGRHGRRVAKIPL